MATEEKNLDKIKRIVMNQKNIRNIATSAHIHHGKTAFTDNLLAAAGKMSTKSAGDLEAGMATWQHADEQERLMTVDAANVSMVHSFNGEEFLVNLIDTPGHVDFSGNVTRAMRAIDGTVVLACASEGIMPQTETVLKQGLRERVRPVLFINKVDRLIKELKVTPQQMQEKFKKIIDEFNMLIANIAEPEFKQKWQVNVADGSVAFGSARDNWALTVPFMKKKGITFGDIYKIYDDALPEQERKDWAQKNASLFEVMLDVVVTHLPSPLEAQRYRIPRVWKGDLESEFGKQLLAADPKGEPAFVITRIVIEPRSGKEISAGRLFSGTLKVGQDVWLNLAGKKQKIQQVLVYDGIRPEQVDEVVAGNVFAIAGVISEVGETVTSTPQTPFEEIKHIFQPVITKSITVQTSADLPKLVEVLRKVAKEDPSIKIEINEETGENLMSGMGELHLEIIEGRIREEKGVVVKTSNPIVVYRETVLKNSGPTEGKSPNRHNAFYLQVEPLEENIAMAMEKGDINDCRLKKDKKDENLLKTLLSLGVSHDEARQYRDIYLGNVLLDKTKGEVHIGEVIELVLDAFEMVMKAGPLSREPCQRLKVSLMDIKLHEDAIHRGPAQVYPAIREGLQAAFKNASPVLFEPVQVHVIEIPTEFMGEVSKLITQKRGQMIDAKQEGIVSFITAKIPVGEMIGWSSDLRSCTGGRGISSLLDQTFERMPNELQQRIIRNIRDRKGLAENQ
ncbi:elongation factor EF-2 [Candidatus Pacearchaeota archaeon]|nr:elongation factor EF-2 [Candidatus Pacearchaeota archaeon]